MWSVVCLQFGACFSTMVAEKQKVNTFQDSGKKKIQISKDNYWLVSVTFLYFKFHSLIFQNRLQEVVWLWRIEDCRPKYFWFITSFGMYVCIVFYDVVAVGLQRGAGPILSSHVKLPWLLFNITVVVSWQGCQFTLHPLCIYFCHSTEMSWYKKKVQLEHSLKEHYRIGFC